MAVIKDVAQGWGPIGLLLPIGLWGVCTQGLGVEPLQGLRLALAASAVCVWPLGRRLNRTSAWSLGFVKKTKHTLFGLPLQWFSLVLLVALLMTFAAALHGGV